MAGWSHLAAAIAAEIVATTLLDGSDGFSRPGVGAAALTGYAIAFYFLTRALRTVPLSVAYAVWSGVGTAAVAVIGVVLLGEALTPGKVLGLGLVVAGVLVLELSGSGSAPATER